mmetsp:Transcript_56927/g.63776  ORF Transcript_56927/g.63776 Transcript_56927/m.63776 type:complete len:105 (+) Transcript_56927:398-712(+)
MGDLLCIGVDELVPLLLLVRRRRRRFLVLPSPGFTGETDNVIPVATAVTVIIFEVLGVVIFFVFPIPASGGGNSVIGVGVGVGVDLTTLIIFAVLVVVVSLPPC